MKPRKTLSIYVLLVGVMGLSIVGGILAFQIFSASIKSQLTAEQREVIKPIDGSINQTVINNLQQRTPISESELLSIVAQPPTAVIVALSPEATQTATPSGSQSVTTP